MAYPWNETNNGRNEVDAVLNSVQVMLAENNVLTRGWDQKIQETIKLLATAKIGETVWPRDTLFAFLQTMEELQENMKEYQELSNLAGKK